MGLSSCGLVRNPLFDREQFELPILDNNGPATLSSLSNPDFGFEDVQVCQDSGLD
jgi:hypothetical protein